MFQPERLTLARQRRGLTKTALAKECRVTPATITAHEKGTSEPSGPTLERLAGALTFPVAFFHEELNDSLSTDSASFRALSRMTAAQRDSALAAGTLSVLVNEWIEARFDLPEVDIPQLESGVIDPEGAAALVRTEWGLGETPIPNLLHLLEAHGVRAFSLVDECREVDAFSFWHQGRPFVCLNTRKSAERSIFDSAHELGHLVLHRDHGAPRGRPEELQANQFASSFLMPEADVVSTMPRSPDLADLINAKHRWRASTAALNFRLHQLGITSDWHYRELCIEISRLGRTIEPNPLPREQSQLLSKVLAHLRHEGLGRREIAAALAMYQPDLDALMFGLTLSSVSGGNEGVGRERDHLRLVTP